MYRTAGMGTDYEYGFSNGENATKEEVKYRRAFFLCFLIDNRVLVSAFQCFSCFFDEKVPVTLV